jgi:hypothetical protein
MFTKKIVYQKGLPKMNDFVLELSQLRNDFMSKVSEWNLLTGKNFFDTDTGEESDEILAGLLVLENTLLTARPFVERMFKGGDTKADRILDPLISLLNEISDFIQDDIQYYKDFGFLPESNDDEDIEKDDGDPG